MADPLPKPNWTNKQPASWRFALPKAPVLRDVTSPSYRTRLELRAHRFTLQRLFVGIALTLLLFPPIVGEMRSCRNGIFAGVAVVTRHHTDRGFPMTCSDPAGSTFGTLHHALCVLPTSKRQPRHRAVARSGPTFEFRAFLCSRFGFTPGVFFHAQSGTSVSRQGDGVSIFFRRPHVCISVYFLGALAVSSGQGQWCSQSACAACVTVLAAGSTS